MKKQYYLFSTLIFVVGFVSTTFGQNVGINSTGAAPDASAALDVSATNLGLLLPRVALTATNVAGPITAPVISLVVYNNATAGVAPNDVTPGFYYWDGAKWVRFANSSENDWTKATTTSTPAIKTDNQYIMGNAGVGISAPIGRFDVQGTTVRTGTAPTTPSLYVTGTLTDGRTGPAAGNIEFRHDNQTQGIGFGYQSIYAASSAATQPLNLLSKGTDPITLNAYAYSTGNVGIGTATPGFPLTVRTATATANTNVTSLANAISDQNFQLNATRGATTNAVGDVMTAFGQAYNGAAISEGFRFLRGTGGNDGAMSMITGATERMRVTFTGNVGIGTATPNAAALVDITSTSKGLLIPRVALTATNVAGPVTAPVTSLMVYNTATAGTFPNDVRPGFYYWNGTAWVAEISKKTYSSGPWVAGGGGLSGVPDGEMVFAIQNINCNGLTHVCQFYIANGLLWIVDAQRVNTNGVIWTGTGTTVITCTMGGAGSCANVNYTITYTAGGTLTYTNNNGGWNSGFTMSAQY